MNLFYKVSFLNFVYLWKTTKVERHKDLIITNAIMMFFAGSLTIIAITLILKMYILLILEVGWCFFIYDIFSKKKYLNYYHDRLVKRDIPNKWLWAIVIDGAALLLLLGIARTIDLF